MGINPNGSGPTWPSYAKTHAGTRFELMVRNPAAARGLPCMQATSLPGVLHRPLDLRSTVLAHRLPRDAGARRRRFLELEATDSRGNMRVGRGGERESYLL